MKFTVLGSTGFIGAHVRASLHAAGIEVFAPARNDTELFSQDLGHVIYCIGLTSDFRDRPFDTVRAHVCVLTEILESARFESFLYLSSTRVYGDGPSGSEAARLSADVASPSDLYNVSKMMGESLCLCASSNDKIRVARLSNVYGEDFQSDNFLSSLIREAVDSGYVKLRTAPDSRKDYVSVRDVAEVLPKISLRGRFRLYNVASGLNIENGAILARLCRITGCRAETLPNAPSISFPPIDISRLGEEFSFRPASLLDDLPLLIQNYREYKTC